ncbi:hypothetical protein C2G38_1054397 [Gigaspora rosea]|uniref:Uncharacterized protein n=1 Tax=Gigaspora rosea TaxID=44941 RepID=A0A397VIN7_9GLOM|nr:hypothetical protein C2G38_1054397 [Gigaspora rosea]
MIKIYVLRLVNSHAPHHVTAKVSRPLVQFIDYYDHVTLRQCCTFSLSQPFFAMSQRPNVPVSQVSQLCPKP